MSKKVMAFLLSLSLMLSLIAAGTAEEANPYGKYEEPVSITVLSEDFKTGTTNYDANDPARKSASENIWISAYKDYLNIDVSRIVAEDTTALNALINTSLASGDMPDVIICSKDMFYTLAENGVLVDLSDYYNNYTQGRLVKAAFESLDQMNACTIDGQMLGFPNVNNFYNCTQLLWIRQDWLDKVNMEAPTTIDEMLDVARAFQTANLGGSDTMGFGMLADAGGTNHFSDYYGFMAAYGAVLGTWMEQDDGSFIWGHTSDAVRKGLLTLQSAYSEGLISSDFGVMDQATLSEKVANGICGMYYATGWHVVTDMKTNMINDPDADWICVAVPTVDGNRVNQFTNASCSMFTCVTTACENPEAIFKMMELEQHMYTEPTAEEIPVYYADPDDNFLYWDLRIFRNFGSGTFDLDRSAIVCAALEENLPVEEISPLATDFYNQCLKYLDGDRSMKGRYICQTMSYPLIDSLYEQELLVAAYNGPLTENMTLYQETLNAELNTAMIKVIMGEDISVWEKGVEDWYKNGGNKITEEVNEFYQGL